MLAGVADGQDRSDWQSLAHLHAGDNLRLSLKTGTVKGAFQNWTPQDVTAGTVTAKREDVLKIERYRKGGGRGKSAAIGALIGFGVGFGTGAAVDKPCRSGQWCFLSISRGLAGAVVGAAGAVVGAGIGVLLPRRPKDLIYAVP
jgi:outer membrane lipoprotein SlyB